MTKHHTRYEPLLNFLSDVRHRMTITFVGFRGQTTGGGGEQDGVEPAPHHFQDSCGIQTRIERWRVQTNEGFCREDIRLREGGEGGGACCKQTEVQPDESTPRPTVENTRKPRFIAQYFLSTFLTGARQIRSPGNLKCFDQNAPRRAPRSFAVHSSRKITQSHTVLESPCARGPLPGTASRLLLTCSPLAAAYQPPSCT